MSDEQLLVTLGVQDKGATTQIKSLNQELKYLDSQYKLTSQGSKDFENTTEGLRQKLSYLEKSYDANTTKLEVYKKKQQETESLLKAKQDELEKLNAAEGDNSKAIEKTQRQIASYQQSLISTNRNINLTETQLKNLFNQIGDTNKALEDKSADAFKENLDKIQKSAEKAGESVKGVGEKISKGISLPAAGAATALGAMAVQTENDLSTLGGRLGTTGEETENLKKVAQTLYRSGYGESLSDCVNDLIVLQQNIKDTANMTDDQKESMLEQIATMKTLFGLESSEITKTISTMKNNGFIKDTQEGLNLITAGFQKGANASDDFMDTLNEYGPQFMKLGLNGETATNMIINGLKAGAFNTDVFADAVKEFSLRAIDGSTTTIDGFTRIGFNADAMAKKFAQGGDTAKQALFDTVNGLKNMKDPVAQNTAGVDLFGTKWEDLGKTVIFSIGDATDSLGDITDATKKAGTEVNNTLSSQFTTALRETKQELLPLGVEFLNLAKDVLPVLAEKIKSVTSIFENMTDGQKKIVVQALIFGAAIGPITSGLGNIIIVGGKAVETVGKLGIGFKGATVATEALGEATVAGSAASGGMALSLGGVLPLLGALAPAAIAAGGAYEVMKAGSDLSNKSILDTTDNMGVLEKTINGLEGGFHKSNQELIDMGIKYSDFTSGVSPEFQKAVEDSAAKVRDFNQYLKDINLDGVITKEESQGLQSRVAQACQDAITTINSYSDPGKQALVNAFSLDGIIDKDEQAIVDSYSKKSDVAKDQITKLGQEINSLETQQEKQFSQQRADQIKADYQKIQEIKLQSEAKTQEELNALNTNWLEQIKNVDANAASDFLQQRAAERDKDNEDTVNKNKAAIDILNQQIATTTGVEKEGYQKEKAALEQANTEKLMENRQAFEKYYAELKANNPKIAENINMVTGEIMSQQQTKHQQALLEMQNHLTGMNEITKSGYYQMYNTTTNTMDKVAVTVDEKTGLIVGAFNTTHQESGEAMDGMMIKAQQLANTTSVTSANMVSNYMQMASSTIDSQNRVIGKNGEVIGSLDQVSTHSDGTKTAIWNLNGTPIKINIDSSGAINGLNDITNRMHAISNMTITMNMRQNWTSDGRGGVFVPEGYASGTESATKGVHLVGENGPELVYFSGGETVITADKTKNLLASGSFYDRNSVDSKSFVNTVNNYNNSVSNTSSQSIDTKSLASAITNSIANAISGLSINIDGTELTKKINNNLALSIARRRY